MCIIIRTEEGLCFFNKWSKNWLCKRIILPNYVNFLVGDISAKEFTPKLGYEVRREKDMGLHTLFPSWPNPHFLMLIQSTRSRGSTCVSLSTSNSLGNSQYLPHTQYNDTTCIAIQVVSIQKSNLMLVVRKSKV